MPVCRVTRILRTVDHADGNDVLVWGIAGQDATAAPSRPASAPLNSLASEIHSGRARSIDSVHLGWPPVCIHEDAALLVSRFKPVGHSHAKHPFLVVIEDGLIKRLERDDLIDNAGVLPPRKDIARGVFQKVLAFAGHPERLDDKLSLIRPALG